MNFLKLDAGLLSACEDASETEASSHPLEVFVHTTAPPTREQAELLRRFGVRNVRPDRNLFTATISLEGLDALSELSWVKGLRIARRLFPAEER